MYLHKSGLLGASPDAITDECVIEIKCPYSFRKEKNLEMLFLPETGYIIIRAVSYNANYIPTNLLSRYLGSIVIARKFLIVLRRLTGPIT